MKKMLLAILSCLYLVVTSGMQVQHHYCMGHLEATTIGFQEANKCGTCGMEMSSNECCHDESQWLKVKDNHGAAAILNILPAPLILSLPPVVYFLVKPSVRQTPVLSISNHSPPPLLPTNRFVLFCIFRI